MKILISGYPVWCARDMTRRERDHVRAGGIFAFDSMWRRHIESRGRWPFRVWRVLTYQRGRWRCIYPDLELARRIDSLARRRPVYEGWRSTTPRPKGFCRTCGSMRRKRGCPWCRSLALRGEV